MLYLISLGLWNEKDMSLKALETARKCNKLYVEFYTTKMNTTPKKLSKLIGKEVKELARKDLEEGTEKILTEARNNDVGILVGGDALVATTHISLLLDAKKLGIPYKVIHGSSIYSAVAATGLQIYKFGKTTTLVYPEKTYQPTSCYRIIKNNKKMGLHTLILLDIKSEKGKYMNIKQGLEILLDMEKKHKEGIIRPETKIVAACELGGNEIIKYRKVKNLINDKELENKIPAVIIIPGNLHFMEKEFLKNNQ